MLFRSVGADDLLNVFLPKTHAGFLTVFGAEFCGFEEDDDEAVEGVDFVFGEVIFGNEDVGFADFVAFPDEQSEVRVVGIGAGGDEFGGGILGDCVGQGVLGGGEKVPCAVVGFVVVGAEGEELADFLIKAFFRGANVADARQHLVEMIGAVIGVFEAFVVHDETFEQILF